MLSLNEDENSIFYKKINTEKIGITGHSQGGVGVINAANNYENGSLYKALFTASCTEHGLSESLKWPYDVSKISAPYFMCAGTESPDDNPKKGDGICPLWSLKENMGELADGVVAIRARVSGVGHGEMLYYPDGYMTSWFRYYLCGDSTAGEVFFGAQPEITANTKWVDVSYHE